MKKMLLLGALLSSTTFAHEPYVAPLAYVTENSQTPVLSGYAENALSSEYALNDIVFTVMSPSQKSSRISPESHLKSTSVFDLALPEDGTYQISATVGYPLKYAQHDKQWKPVYDATAEKAGPLADRDYLIPSDFKKMKVENVVREWSIESYVSKNKTSAITQKIAAPLSVSFSAHPNEIKAATATNILVMKDQQILKNAEVNILAQGATEDQATQFVTNAEGIAEVQFPTAGQYLVEVTETNDLKKKPVNQYYTIVSLNVNP